MGKGDGSTMADSLSARAHRGPVNDVCIIGMADGSLPLLPLGTGATLRLGHRLVNSDRAAGAPGTNLGPDGGEPILQGMQRRQIGAARVDAPGTLGAHLLAQLVCFTLKPINVGHGSPLHMNDVWCERPRAFRRGSMVA
jgi:hypothetical protein